MKEDFLFIEPSEFSYKIRERMTLDALFMSRDKICDIILGEGIQSLGCWHQTPQPGDLSILRGDDIQMWHIRGSLHFSPLAPELERYRANIERLHFPHVVTQRIVAHIRYPRSHIILMAAFDVNGSFAFNTVVHFLIIDQKFDYRYILGLLNSKLLSFYAYKFIYNNAIRSMDFYQDYAGRLPIKLASSQKEIIDIVDSIIAHFQKSQLVNPVFQKYMTEKVIGFREFNDYYRELAPNERDPIDTQTNGVIKRLNVKENGEWLLFSVDYLDQQKHRIITGYNVLRCEFRDRAIRTFLREEISSKGAANHGNRLLDKILSIKIPSFHKLPHRDKELIRTQLNPFLRDFDAHAKWEEAYTDLDNMLNNRIYKIYGLSEEEINHVEDNSKSSGWHVDTTT